MWIWVIIIAIIIGAIWGALTSKDGEKSEGAFAGAVTGGRYGMWICTNSNIYLRNRYNDIILVV